MTERRKSGSRSRGEDQPKAAASKKKAAAGADKDQTSKRASARAKPKFTISDKTPEIEETSETRGARPRRGMRIVVLVVAVIAIGAAVSVLMLREPAVPPPVIAEKPRADNGLAALEARIGALEQRIGQTTDDPALAKLTEEVSRLGQRVADRDDLSTVEKSIDDLEAKLAAMATRTSEAAATSPELMAQFEALRGDIAKLNGTIAEIDARLTRLDKGMTAENAGRATTLVLATAQLRRALQDSGPFLAELDAFQRLVGEDPAIIRALQPWAGRADKGIPTVALLQRRFATVMRAALQAAAQPKQQGWVGETLARVTKLVTVRPTGDAASGEGAGALLAQAKSALDGGDLGAAVAKLEGLDGAAAAAVADWLGDARLRLATEDGLRALQTLAIARMTADNTTR